MLFAFQSLSSIQISFQTYSKGEARAKFRADTALNSCQLDECENRQGIHTL